MLSILVFCKILEYKRRYFVFLRLKIYNKLMSSLIAQWFFNAFGVLTAGYFIPGVSVVSFYTGLIVAVILGALNLFVRPILILLTLPITFLTLGLFTLVINAFLFWFLSSFIKGFSVSGFFAAFFGALTVSVISFLGRRIIEAIV